MSPIQSFQDIFYRYMDHPSILYLWIFPLNSPPKGQLRSRTFKNPPPPQMGVVRISPVGVGG